MAGVGSFVSEDGLLLTAAHVVHKPEDRLELLLPGDKLVTATCVAIDLGHDLALLKTDSHKPSHHLAISDQPPVAGTPIFLIGDPTMYPNIMLHGRIARPDVGVTLLGNHDSYIATLMVAASVTPGASGGCWVDDSGQIIGVQSSFIGDDKGSTGLAFVGPASAAAELLKNKQDRPATTLGGELVSMWKQHYGFNKRLPKDTRGVAIYRIMKGGPLDRAKIPKDHVITHLNGKPVPRNDDIIGLIRQEKPGDLVKLRVISPDAHEVSEVEVVLDKVTWD